MSGCIQATMQQNTITVNSRFKKDLKLQIHLHKAFFSDDRFLDSLHKSFLNQTTLDLRKEKWTFLNREFTVVPIFKWKMGQIVVAFSEYLNLINRAPKH